MCLFLLVRIAHFRHLGKHSGHCLPSGPGNDQAFPDMPAIGRFLLRYGPARIEYTMIGDRDKDGLLVGKPGKQEYIYRRKLRKVMSDHGELPRPGRPECSSPQ